MSRGLDGLICGAMVFNGIENLSKRVHPGPDQGRSEDVTGAQAQIR